MPSFSALFMATVASAACTLSSAAPASGATEPSSSVAVVATSTDAPAPTDTANPTNSNCKSSRVYFPDLYKVMPQQPRWFDDPLNRTISNSWFYMQQDFGGINPKLQVMVFKDVPKDAVNCGMGWWQPVQGTNFGTYGNGDIEVIPISIDKGKTFTEQFGEKPTFEKIEGKLGARGGMLGFANWPQVQGTQQGSSSMSIPCQSEMAFLADFNDIAKWKESMVSIENSKQWGLYLSAGCEEETSN